MRASPRIKVKFWQESLSLSKDVKPFNTGCSICKKICVDEKKNMLGQSGRLTRSASKWANEIRQNIIIIYETYRCMPLLGDEKIHAPDWEEHIVRYHIVFVNK